MAGSKPKWKFDGVRVVRSNELDINTAQTPGMNRAAAITHARAGAEKVQRLLPVGRGGHPEPVVPQGLAQALAQIRIVFHDEDFPTAHLRSIMPEFRRNNRAHLVSS